MISDKPPHSPSASPHSPEAQWGKAPANDSERLFLKGPQPRTFDLWHAAKIFFEIVHGFRSLHFVGPCVTVFGSARFLETDPEYRQAREVGAGLGQAGFTVMTGGGPGIMEAANRGAKDVGAISIGCNIELPKEQAPNAYLDRWIQFRHFFVRKLMLVKYSYAFVVMPGGFGTLDEAFETLTLIQTDKIRHFPVVFVGRAYWGPLMDFLRDGLLARGSIGPKDLELLYLTDSPTEAVERVKEHAIQQFGLTYSKRPKPRWLLGERRPPTIAERSR